MGDAMGRIYAFTFRSWESAFVSMRLGEAR
jgi:hypothetical protein